MGESRLHYGMSLRLYFEEKAFGPGMVMLLREVERTGSLQKAAKNMNGHPESYDLHKEDYDPDSLHCILCGSGPDQWLQMPDMS